jgi:hypothetical protein
MGPLREDDACKIARAALDGWLDAELGPEDAAAMERHLSACPHCRAEAALLRAITGTVRQIAQVEPDPGLRARLLAHVRREATTRRVCIEEIEMGGTRILRRSETGASPVSNTVRSVAMPPVLSMERTLFYQQQVRAEGGTIYWVTSHETEWRAGQ